MNIFFLLIIIFLRDILLYGDDFMKFSQIPYKRYTIEEGRMKFAEFEKLSQNAENANDMIEARKAVLEMMNDYQTAASLANCRFTLNTADEFYKAEMDYYDTTGPMFSDLFTKYADIMLSSPFRAETEKKINPQIFRKLECQKKSFDICILEESQEENALTTEYSQFMSSIVFEFDGKEMPLSVLRGYLENSDRDIRKKAAEALGKGLEKHRDTLDSIFDKLVDVRNRMAKKMGYENFVELGYYRMGRTDYTPEMIEIFRDNVREHLVPCISKIKKDVAAELGIDRVMFYDNDIYFAGETPKPFGNEEEIFKKAQEMYDDMSPEIGDFMRSMIENEAFDVTSRPNKWGGGYCTVFNNFRQPFILANFNGTTGDIDVITHEFGHALAAHNVFIYGDAELDVGGMETAECHSMSMEFLSWKYMDKFFGDDAPRYRKKHLLDALSFIPYGVIVDEFQHIIYSHPEYTPEERKNAYLKLEEKYRPYLSFDGIPYLEEGTRWQYQMHIYESPFYYIDYCLAQTVALGFLIKSQENYDDALKTYISFNRKGGTEQFPELVKNAHLSSPFEDGALKTLAEKVLEVARNTASE